MRRARVDGNCIQKLVQLGAPSPWRTSTHRAAARFARASCERLVHLDTHDTTRWPDAVRHERREVATPGADQTLRVRTERHRRHRSMIFTTNKSLEAWGRVLHDDDLAQAIIDRVLERGRLLRLDGPSVRTLHVNLDDAMKEDSDQQADLIRISGNTCPEFPEPTGSAPGICA